MHTRPQDIVEKDRHFTLFVRLPTADTLGLRHLGRSVTVAEIRDRLEILAGLPCEVYTILAPGGDVLAESAKLHFGRQLRNGAILKTEILPQYENLFISAKNNHSDTDNIYSIITGTGTIDTPDSDEDGKNSNALNDLSNSERSFFLLYLASHFGHHTICKTIVRLDPEAHHRVTCFGRTALHVAAASDQIKVVNLLLSCGAPLSAQDSFGKTPLEYSKETGACTCERALRYKVLTKSKTSGPQSQDVPSSKIKTASRPRDAQRDDVENNETDSTDRRIVNTEHSATTGDVNVQTSAGKISGDGSPRRLLVRTEAAGTSATSRNHKGCSKVPSFVATRKIPLEEQKLVTVEFTPMERPAIAPSTCSRPRSGFHPAGDKHAWAEKVARSKVQASVAINIRSRTKSAQYYKTKYHERDEITEYKARPATAGPRFRFWKTWMIEKLEQKAAEDELSQQDEERRKRNMAAYKRWLAKKDRLDAQKRETEASASSEEDIDSEEDRDDNLGYGNWPSPREQAFQKWLESKRSTIVQMARRRRREEEERAQRESCSTRRKDIYDRRLTVFEIGCTDPTPIRHPPTDKYITSYKMWLAKKERYEAWKEKNHVHFEDQDEVKAKDLEVARETFFFEGMTYEEWLGMKHRESKQVKA